MRRYLTGAAAGVALLASYGTANAAWILTDTNGGDGHLGTPGAGYNFEIIGANNNVGESLASLTFTASTPEVLTFNWSYTTEDCCGSYWDPGGYILNGVETQLTPSVGPYADDGATYTGSFAIDLAPGDTFGFYIDSRDSVEGPGIIEFAEVPEPATWAIMLFGFGAAGAVLRQGRKRARTGRVTAT